MLRTENRFLLVDKIQGQHKGLAMFLYNGARRLQALGDKSGRVNYVPPE